MIHASLQLMGERSVLGRYIKDRIMSLCGNHKGPMIGSETLVGTGDSIRHSSSKRAAYCFSIKSRRYILHPHPCVYRLSARSFWGQRRGWILNEHAVDESPWSAFGMQIDKGPAF